MQRAVLGGVLAVLGAPLVQHRVAAEGRRVGFGGEGKERGRGEHACVRAGNLAAGRWARRCI